MAEFVADLLLLIAALVLVGSFIAGLVQSNTSIAVSMVNRLETIAVGVVAAALIAALGLGLRKLDHIAEDVKRSADALERRLGRKD